MYLLVFVVFFVSCLLVTLWSCALLQFTIRLPVPVSWHGYINWAPGLVTFQVLPNGLPFLSGRDGFCPAICCFVSIFAYFNMILLLH